MNIEIDNLKISEQSQGLINEHLLVFTSISPNRKTKFPEPREYGWLGLKIWRLTTG